MHVCIYALPASALFLSEFKHILHFLVCVRTCVFVYVCAQILVCLIPPVILTSIKTDFIPSMWNDCETYMAQVSALFMHTSTLCMHTENAFDAHKHARYYAVYAHKHDSVKHFHPYLETDSVIARRT